MEIRTFSEQQVRVYKLILNRMTSPKIEYMEIVALSTDYEKLVEWYESQRAPLWRDGQWGKSFKAGSTLEWFNPAHSLELNDTYPFGHGISDQWIPVTAWNEICLSGNYFIVR